MARISLEISIRIYFNGRSRLTSCPTFPKRRASHQGIRVYRSARRSPSAGGSTRARQPQGLRRVCQVRPDRSSYIVIGPVLRIVGQQPVQLLLGAEEAVERAEPVVDAEEVIAGLPGQFVDYRFSRRAERHDVGQIPLHPRGWNVEQRPFAVDLAPAEAGHLGSPLPGQDQELDPLLDRVAQSLARSPDARKLGIGQYSIPSLLPPQKLGGPEPLRRVRFDAVGLMDKRPAEDPACRAERRARRGRAVLLGDLLHHAPDIALRDGGARPARP